LQVHLLTAGVLALGNPREGSRGCDRTPVGRERIRGSRCMATETGFSMDGAVESQASMLNAPNIAALLS
jgi:hypothetical protein